jgi:signal transduction histidine kinase
VSRRDVESIDGLVSGMGHELRTPLNAIIGFTDLLLMELPGPLNDAQRQHLAQIGTAGRTMLGMTDNLVELARLELGEIELQVAPSALGPILDDVRSAYLAQAAEKGLSLEVESPSPDPCETDPKVLRRIVELLVANALAFTDTGGVTIHVREAGAPGAVRIEVVDSGPGISEHDLAMLFRPFDRAASDAGGERRGMGLGLCLGRRLADLLGAEIAVASEVGRGTTGSVTLPGSRSR